ncbi:MAG: glutamate decarboxylase, partial [Solirubrobacteraceae bacterium]|nr:glutamate decarboxylase [Solirubrobacteraceae bacterium]
MPLERLSDKGLGGEISYELISSELLLDGQARLNLATFVTTWMPSTAAKLMADT